MQGITASSYDQGWRRALRRVSRLARVLLLLVLGVAGVAGGGGSDFGNGVAVDAAGRSRRS